MFRMFLLTFAKWISSISVISIKISETIIRELLFKSFDKSIYLIVNNFHSFLSKKSLTAIYWIYKIIPSIRITTVFSPKYVMIKVNRDSRDETLLKVVNNTSKLPYILSGRTNNLRGVGLGLCKSKRL